jgi:hypothetical protein
MSVSPKGELVITHYDRTELIIMDDNGREVPRLETGSKCARCVMDTQDNVYVTVQT